MSKVCCYKTGFEVLNHTGGASSFKLQASSPTHLDL
jgi:hypothetical protein